MKPLFTKLHRSESLQEMTEHGTVVTERFTTSEHGCIICNLILDSSFNHELASQVHSSMLTMPEVISGFYVINRRSWDFVGFPFFIFLTDFFFQEKKIPKQNFPRVH